jgi:hypothetical protein
MPDDTRFSDRPDVSTILGAAKMTGQTLSGWKLGLIEAVTARETASYIGADDLPGSAVVEPATNYFVARADRNLREGQTSIGAIATAMNRRIEDDGLDALLRSSAYTAGLDFSHEFRDRSWEVSGYYAFSHVSGSPLALVRTQRSSARYFQRPDADYVDVDSSRTALAGHAAKIELRKIAGVHWRGSAELSTTSPGFEINDIGFQSTVDRVGADLELTWVENQPGDIFRNYRVSGRLSRDWNYGRDAVGGRASISFNGELANYWGGNVSFTRSFVAYDDHLTRGGPIALDPAGFNVDFRLNSDGRRPFSLRSGGNFSWGESGGWHRSANAGLTVRPAGNWTVSIGPKLSQSRTSAQYIGYADDPTAVATYGRRYIFAPVDQTTLSMETRLNVNFTPELSLEMYGQPFVSSGDYGDAMTLRAPRTYDFDAYEESVEDRDFNTRSLRGNAVLRWEWRPGSTVFLVWQQQRSGSLECSQSRPRCDNGRFDFSRDARSIFDPHPDNVFLLKLNYWLNL